MGHRLPTWHWLLVLRENIGVRPALATFQNFILRICSYTFSSSLLISQFHPLRDSLCSLKNLISLVYIYFLSRWSEIGLHCLAGRHQTLKLAPYSLKNHSSFKPCDDYRPLFIISPCCTVQDICSESALVFPSKPHDLRLIKTYT